MEAKQLKSLIEYFSKPFEHEISKVEYRNAWHLIHSMHNEEAHIQIEIFVTILKFFKFGTCACAHDGWTLFKAIIHELDYFKEIENYQDFWIFYHNQVNLKLSKELYILNKT